MFFFSLRYISEPHNRTWITSKKLNKVHIIVYNFTRVNFFQYNVLWQLIVGSSFITKDHGGFIEDLSFSLIHIKL